MQSAENFSRIKVLFRLEVDEYGYPPVSVEGLWAFVDSHGRIFVDNIPFYIKGLAPGDEISVNSIDGECWFDSIICSIGGSVFRVYAKDENDIDNIRNDLKLLNIETEVNRRANLIALEVNTEISINPVLNYLVGGREDERFDFEEGVLRHMIN